MRAEQQSLTRSMPGPPRRRRRKRPQRTAHLRLRASRGLWEQPRPARASTAKWSSGPALGLPGALWEHPRTLLRPAAGSGWAGQLGVRSSQRSGPAPPENARARRGGVPSAHLGRAFVTPAPPSCSLDPHRNLPDTCAHGQVGPRVSGRAAFFGPNPRRSAHTSSGLSHASVTQAMPACTTMGRQKRLIHTYRYCLIPFLF